MSQLRKYLKTTKPDTEFGRALEQELRSAWLELATMMNKGLGFADNFNSTQIVVTDTGALDTEFAVAHGLKRIPTGYLVLRRNKAGIVYDSGTTFDVTNVYLKFSAANGNITLMIF